jgi:hypothetical protein
MRSRDTKTGRFVSVEEITVPDVSVLTKTPDWIEKFEQAPDLSGEELIELRAADRRRFNRHYAAWLVGTIVAMVAMLLIGIHWSR